MPTIANAPEDVRRLVRRQGSNLAGAWGALVRELYLWADRRSQRARLATLDDRLLRDIGVDRAAAWQEARKPFWRA